jgi:hypothetical protein
MRIQKEQIQEALRELSESPSFINIDDQAIEYLMLNPSIKRFIDSGISMNQLVDITSIVVGSLITGIKIGIEQPSFGRSLAQMDRMWDA